MEFDKVCLPFKKYISKNHFFEKKNYGRDPWDKIMLDVNGKTLNGLSTLLIGKPKAWTPATQTSPNTTHSCISPDESKFETLHSFSFKFIF